MERNYKAVNKGQREKGDGDSIQCSWIKLTKCHFLLFDTI